MSLTSCLNDPTIRERFRETFQKPRVSIKSPILAPPISKDPNLVGMAFDYLVRYQIGRLNRVKHGPSEWVASSGYRLVEANFPGSDLARAAQQIVRRGQIEVEKFYNTGEVTDSLLTSCCELAQVERIFRSKFFEIDPGKIGQDEIEDMHQLSSVFDRDSSMATSRCLLNPTFGDASLLVGGADADLIIDNLLIDIKTTKKIEVSRDYFNQLIGYALLHHINQQTRGISSDPGTSLSRVGIYFSRYAYLWTINLDEIIPDGFDAKFVEWFIGAVKLSPK